MARTQAADYDEKRNIITQKAAQLFAEKGFAAASISDLAAACNVSKSLIYHYCSSKEAILFDVMTTHMDDLVAVVEETVEPDGDPKENLFRLTRGLLRRYVGAAGHQKVLLYELSALPEKQKREIIGKQRTVVAAVERLLQAMDKGKSQPKHVLRARVMLFFGMLNWTDNWLSARGPISRDEIADMATETLIRSL